MHNLKEKVTLMVWRGCLEQETFAVLATRRTPSGTGPGYYQ